MIAILKWKWHKFRTKHNAYYMVNTTYDENSPKRRRCTRCGKVF